MEYLQGPSKSRLDKDELKDAILFFVSLQQDKELVDCGARGRQTNKPMELSMEDAQSESRSSARIPSEITAPDAAAMQIKHAALIIAAEELMRRRFQVF